MSNMKIIAIVQARMGSTRLPGKVMKEACGIPLIGHLLNRLSLSTHIQDIIIATSIDSRDKELISYVTQLGYKSFAGDENDVLDRYYQAAKKFHADIIVRITGDCPLIDYKIVDKTIEHFLEHRFDYVSNVDPPTYPDGLDTEVFTFDALEKSWKNAKEKYDREHVIPYILRENIFKRSSISHSRDLSSERWTVDTPEDFYLVQNIIEHFYPLHKYYGLDDIMEYKNQYPELFLINQQNIRNEGATMNTGQKLWQRAKRIIPGGSSLLSKRSEMFLPEKWPSYYQKAKGISVWDFDNQEYQDMCIMGIGTNLLGYANDEVNEKVIDAIQKSNVSTLNCAEEVYLAEKLIEIHPWAQMVRYARGGGEGMAMAVRIARASARKDKIAFCGYHGWQDWYLAANLSDDKTLDGHLLPGLEPNGVPRGLKDTMFPFEYNNFEQLEQLVAQHDIGVITMEPMRNAEPENNFLQKVRDLATRKNIVLVFDEVTSGFRRVVGGIHLYYKVYPDIAVLGKALGNGHAISAVMGKKEVMEAAQSTFISSTYWTERTGPTAALATLEIMQRDQVPMLIEEYGKYINDSWEKLAKKYDLNIHISGLPALTHFSFEKDNLKYKTFLTQEMLKKRYLAAQSIYVSIGHGNEAISAYIDALDDVFKRIKIAQEQNNIDTLLESPICHTGFKRLI